MNSTRTRHLRKALALLSIVLSACAQIAGVTGDYRLNGTGGGGAGSAGIANGGSQIANGGTTGNGGSQIANGGGTTGNGGTQIANGGTPAGGSAQGGSSTLGGSGTNNGFGGAAGTSVTVGGMGSAGKGGAGGATGTAGAPSGGSGGSAPTVCAVAPVTPNASAQVRKLLCYLYSQYGNHVLSGQQETSLGADPDIEIEYLFKNIAHYPAIRGGDYRDPTTSARAIAWWKAGGIPMLFYTMGAPSAVGGATNADTPTNAETTVMIDSVLEGGANHAAFLAKLDYAAGELKKLQSAGVAALWLPFWDAGSEDAPFWWSAENGAQYVKLWKAMFDYFTSQGVSNVIWLCPFSVTPKSDFYPGKPWVDLSGSDLGISTSSTALLYSEVASIVGPIPAALYANSNIPDPGGMFDASPPDKSPAPWVLFNTWQGSLLPAGINSPNTLYHIMSVYADPHVVTRDQVPDLN